MLRIGVDGHILAGKFQGTRTTLTRMVEALQKYLEDEELYLYTISDRKCISDSILPAPFLRRLYFRSPIMRLLFELPFKLWVDRVDVTLYQYISPFFGKNIVFIHDILPITKPDLFPFRSRLKAKIFFRISAKRARAVITVSRHAASEITQHLKVEKEKLHVVYNGPSFQLESYFNFGPAKDEIYILAVGRIEPRKNIQLLVRAFLNAELAGVKLKIVGNFDPGFPKQTVSGANVEVLSGVSDAELIELYRKASLFVFPSSAEGFGVPLLDALLFGLPTLSSDQTSLPEVGGKLATYFNPTSPSSVLDLSRLIRGHFGSEKIASPSLVERKMLAERFCWDSAARDLLSVIRAIEAE